VSAATSAHGAGVLDSGGPQNGPAVPRRRRRRGTVAAGLAVLAGAGAAVGVTHPFGGKHTEAASNVPPAAFATVTKRSLSSQTQVTATLGYAGQYSVVNQAQGIVTALPWLGEVVKEGDVLYRVNRNAVVLLYGSTPASRTLAAGADASDVTGPDVQELNADLVAMGYASRADLDPDSDEFSWATEAAVEKLQKRLGVPQTGSLDLGTVVFLPSRARVTTVSATLGSSVGAGQAVLSATTTARQVTIALDAAQQSEVKVGNKVTITLPDGRTTPGVVSAVGTVATPPTSSNSSATVTVDVTPLRPRDTGSFDQAPVQVSITTASVDNALVVPVSALLAEAGGGYAIEVIGAGGARHLVPVSTGLFDDADGLVQVTGSGLAAGQHVVVPSS
jgi:Putative peptidoglycan binding domain/HlyD family secretion protein